MSYELFIERFGELAWKETRTVMLREDNQFGLPADEYGLLELYCNDDNCDCRRVMFDVLSRKQNKSVAVIAYGWEEASFYQRWFGGEDSPASRIAVNEMTGLNLNSASHQSEIAPAFLEVIRWLLTDPAYVARIKRHYRMFRDTVDGKPARKITRLTPPVVPPEDVDPVRIPEQKSRRRPPSRRTDN
jgi:hypothetical protein